MPLTANPIFLQCFSLSLSLITFEMKRTVVRSVSLLHFFVSLLDLLEREGGRALGAHKSACAPNSVCRRVKKNSAMWEEEEEEIRKRPLPTCCCFTNETTRIKFGFSPSVKKKRNSQGFGWMVGGPFFEKQTNRYCSTNFCGFGLLSGSLFWCGQWPQQIPIMWMQLRCNMGKLAPFYEYISWVLFPSLKKKQEEMRKQRQKMETK